MHRVIANFPDELGSVHGTHVPIRNDKSILPLSKLGERRGTISDLIDIDESNLAHEPANDRAHRFEVVDDEYRQR